jgi:hypothetical protein
MRLRFGLLQSFNPPDQPLNPADGMEDFRGELERWFHAVIVSSDAIGCKVDSGEGAASSS